MFYIIRSEVYGEREREKPNRLGIKKRKYEGEKRVKIEKRVFLAAAAN